MPNRHFPVACIPLTPTGGRLGSNPITGSVLFTEAQLTCEHYAGSIVRN